MSSWMLKPGCRALHSCRLARSTRLRRRMVPLSTFLPYIEVKKIVFVVIRGCCDQEVLVLVLVLIYKKATLR